MIKKLIAGVVKELVVLEVVRGWVYLLTIQVVVVEDTFLLKNRPLTYPLQRTAMPRIHTEAYLALVARIARLGLITPTIASFGTLLKY